MAIVIFAVDGTILYINRQAERIVGLTRQAVTGLGIRFLYSRPEDHDALIAAFRRGWSIQNVETAFCRSDTGFVPVRVTWDATRFNDQEAIAAWISDDRANRLRVQRLEKIFDRAPLPMILCSYPSSDILMANGRAAELFTIGDGAQASKVRRLVGPQTYQTLMAGLADGGYVEGLETLLKTAYGEMLPASISGQIVTIGDDRGILVAISDITDRKLAEETLRRFFEAAPLALVLIDRRDGVIIQANRRASELVGLTAEAPGGGPRTLETHLGPDETARFQHNLEQGGFVDGFETRFTTDYGETFWAMLSGQVIQIGERACVLVGVNDITEAKTIKESLEAAKEEAERATRVKSLFLATMSHEIRTPMNGVLGMVDVLATTSLDEDQRDSVAVIRRSAQTLLSIIDDILDLSKIEAGKLTVETVPLGLRDTVESTVGLVAPRAREKGLDLCWRVDPALPEPCLGDPVRLRQILINLVGNALKFTEQGMVSVTVTPTDPWPWQAGDRPDRVRVRFCVTDTGIGLTRDQQDRLFQPFSQADASTTRRFGGTGLGLSICQRLVEVMGGVIGVDSAWGQGSRFWFDLPLGVEDRPTPPGPLLDLDGVAVLVVDPSPLTRATAIDILSAAGAQAVGVADGAGALAFLRAENRPEVLVIHDHPDLLSELEELHAWVAASATVVTSFDPTTRPAEIRAARGLAAVVSKPLQTRSLLRAVGVACGQVCAMGADESAEPDRPDPPPRLDRDQALACGRLILVAEDNPTNRLVIARQLDRLGHRFDCVEDGEAAWRALQQTAYGLLLTDCAMPDLDGYDLTRRLRAAEQRATPCADAPTGGGESKGDGKGDGDGGAILGAQDAGPGQHGRRLPVIALTANALDGEADKCRAAGMDDYLSKPVSLERLAVVLDRWLPPAPKQPIAAERPADPPPPAAGPIPAPSAALIDGQGQDPAPPKPAVDRAALADLFGEDDPALLAEVLDCFVAAFPASLARLTDALAARDRLGVRDAAHSAKGAAANAGAGPLAARLGHLEEASPRAPVADLEALARDLPALFAAVVAYRDGLRAPDTPDAPRT